MGTILFLAKSLSVGMESSYGIGVTNRYAIFLDEDEDSVEESTPKQSDSEPNRDKKFSEKENKSVEAKLIKGAKEAQTAKQRHDSSSSKEWQSVKTVSSRKERTDRKQDHRDSEEKSNNFHSSERESESSSNPSAEHNGSHTGADKSSSEFAEFRVRTSRSNRGRGRGTGRPGHDNRGKREYDRQSGSDKTGIKPVGKKDGGGAHNWGSHRDAIVDQLKSAKVPEEQDWNSPEKSGGPVAEKSGGPVAEKSGGPVAVNNKEQNSTQKNDKEGEIQHTDTTRELTLDEYKALKGTRQKPTFNLRKAGEGEDLSQWKNMYALTKKNEAGDEESEEYDISDYPQRVGRQKHVLDIDIRFSDSRRGTRGRGRGTRITEPRRGTTGPGMGSSRSTQEPIEKHEGIPNEPREKADHEVGETRPRIRQNAPKVDDEHDFPSLG